MRKSQLVPIDSNQNRVYYGFTSEDERTAGTE